MSELNETENISCPSCDRHNIKIIIEKENENYDLTSGILGTICLSPIGMLCGLCCADGEKKKTTCICNECGTKFNG